MIDFLVTNYRVMMFKYGLVGALCLIFSLSALANSGDTLIIGKVGYPEIQHASAPDGIVMKDAAGNDALVIFYHSGKNKVSFVVSRDVNVPSGTLKWSKVYNLKSSVMVADEFSPVPVLLNDALYLFGREHINKIGRYYIYNSFDNVEDLIAHSEGKHGERPYKPLGVRGQDDLGVFSAAAVDNSIVLAYHEREGKKKSATPITSTRCTANAHRNLSCVPVATSDQKYDDPAVLVPIHANGVPETLMLVRAPATDTLSMYKLELGHKKWRSLYSIGKLELPKSRVGAAEFNGKLHVFYTDPRSRRIEILTSSVHTSEILDPAAMWSRPSVVPNGLQSSGMVKPIAFKNRLYVFFRRDDRRLAQGQFDSYYYISKGPLAYYSNLVME